ncbi:hypothetical protein Q8A73_018099 [Channa argus]|nr:hypothetical protein Q8A73_018099 [Channa argus]
MAAAWSVTLLIKSRSADASVPAYLPGSTQEQGCRVIAVRLRFWTTLEVRSDVTRNLTVDQKGYHDNTSSNQLLDNSSNFLHHTSVQRSLSEMHPGHVFTLSTPHVSRSHRPKSISDKEPQTLQEQETGQSAIELKASLQDHRQELKISSTRPRDTAIFLANL